jgi:diguanylate cyclase (GGDEF)-like protein
VDLRFDSPDGGVRWLRVAGKPVFDARGGFRGFRGTGRDVTRERLLAERLEHQASHDQLTGLRNRRAFEAHLEELLAGGRETAEEHVLCYLDLDQFKVVNDTCGHAAGDLLLQRVAGLLRARLRRGDAIARLGGDEFGVVLEHCPLEEGRRITESLRETIAEEPFVYGDRGFRITASIGLVPVPGGAESVADLLGRADAACYAAKDFGRNRVHGFEADDAELARRRGEMRWVSRIHEALERDRFRLYAQPIVARSPDGVPGAHLELLLRLAAESGEELPPGAFLPAAERYHLSPLIDRWVVERALAWLGEDPERLARIGLCWVNLSALSVGDDAFARFLTGCFHRTGVPPAKVCFEITETAAIANLGTAGRLIRELRALGCRIALDDFGSGLSSYGYLKSLPVDYLKIDGGFVRDILEDPVSHATVRSINEIGHVMGKQTVAEFVENAAILAAVAALGVDYVQGYGVGHPVPLESLDLLGGGPGIPEGSSRLVV